MREFGVLKNKTHTIKVVLGGSKLDISMRHPDHPENCLFALMCNANSHTTDVDPLKTNDKHK